MIQRIQELLAAGATHRTIAQELGVSRTLVGQVKRGERLQRERSEPEVSFQPIEPTRCGGCGAIVTEYPCRLCYLKAVTHRGEAQPAPTLGVDEFPAGPSLPPAEQEGEVDSASYLDSKPFQDPNVGPTLPGNPGDREPSPEQIRRRCAAIRSTWSAARLGRLLKPELV